MSIPVVGWFCFALGLAVGAGCCWQCMRVVLRAKDQRLQQALSEARTDALTGVWNRRAFEDWIAMQAAISRRYQVSFSILLIDVDHFKSINDTHGHQVGDIALHELARVFQASSRESDFVARYGGEEFAVLLPQTDLAGGLTLAHRIQTRLQAAPIAVGELRLPVRVSIGVAALQPDEPTDSLVSRADQALYASKRAGRNRIHLHDGRQLCDVTADPHPQQKS